MSITCLILIVGISVVVGAVQGYGWGRRDVLEELLESKKHE